MKNTLKLLFATLVISVHAMEIKKAKIEIEKSQHQELFNFIKETDMHGVKEYLEKNYFDEETLEKARCLAANKWSSKNELVREASQRIVSNLDAKIRELYPNRPHEKLYEAIQYVDIKSVEKYLENNTLDSVTLAIAKNRATAKLWHGFNGSFDKRPLDIIDLIDKKDCNERQHQELFNFIKETDMHGVKEYLEKNHFDEEALEFARYLAADQWSSKNEFVREASQRIVSNLDAKIRELYPNRPHEKLYEAIQYVNIESVEKYLKNNTLDSVTLAIAKNRATAKLWHGFNGSFDKRPLDIIDLIDKKQEKE